MITAYLHIKYWVIPVKKKNKSSNSTIHIFGENIHEPTTLFKTPAHSCSSVQSAKHIATLQCMKIYSYSSHQTSKLRKTYDLYVCPDSCSSGVVTYPEMLSFSPRLHRVGYYLRHPSFPINSNQSDHSPLISRHSIGRVDNELVYIS